MHHFLIPVLLLSLVAGCSSLNVGPHRIDVQQGNALDQENVARLKPGLTRSQVRFLLGTPLLADLFHPDRWDYVYVNYKAGRLAEQKRITLIFDGETLARIEGDLPEGFPAMQPLTPAVKPELKTETMALPVAAEVKLHPLSPLAVPAASGASQDNLSPSVASKSELAVVTQAAVVTAPQAAPTPVTVIPSPVPVILAPVSAQAVAAPAAVAPAVAKASGPTSRTIQAHAAKTSIVSALPASKIALEGKAAPVKITPRSPGELSLQPESDAEKIKPDTIPPFPVSNPVSVASDAPALKALNAWANAWSHRDEDAYIAAYDASFVPVGGGTRADWEKSRRFLLNVAKNIELKISSPSVDTTSDGSATVTFNQFYRSESYRDAVVKQLRMVERDGRWLIVEEKVLSILRSAKP